MGTRKISQLETISDANLSGEAILPVVVSDPLIPNRKAKINQLFKGLSQGTKASPGLCFDLDRDSGLYQNAYDQLGIAFGDGGFYCTRIDNGNSSTSLYIPSSNSPGRAIHKRKSCGLAQCRLHRSYMPSDVEAHHREIGLPTPHGS